MSRLCENSNNLRSRNFFFHNRAVTGLKLIRNIHLSYESNHKLTSEFHIELSKIVFTQAVPFCDISENPQVIAGNGPVRANPLIQE